MMSSVVQCIVLRIQRALSPQSDPAVTIAALAEQFDCLNAMLRGIQQPTEDPETGIPISTPADERKIYLETLKRNISAVWPIIPPVIRLAGNNEDIIQVCY
jgi:hypothetical protein